MNPLISIIIPIYNSENYLSRCINSIIKQTYSKWELILINDGSTDNSGKICEEYCKNDIRIKYYQISNSGAAEARLTGVKQSSGEYICFVDSDDSLPQDTLEILYLYNKNNEYDIVVGGFTKVFHNGKKDYCSLPKRVLSNKEYLLDLLSGNWKLYGPVAKLFKRNLFENYTIIIPKSIYIGEDLLTNVYLASKANNIIQIPHSLYYYHQIETSLTHNFSYTIDYMNNYILILKNILTSLNISNIEELIIHYQINMMYNVMLDDKKEEINYKSNIVEKIINKSFNIELNKKEIIIIYLLKYHSLRILFRHITNEYRKGKGLLYQILKILKQH